MFVVFVLLVFIALIPAAIAQSKGRNFILWWLYGMAFFIVALPHALLMAPDQRNLDAKGLSHGQRKCPHCAELIREEANVCRFCSRDVQPMEAARVSTEDLQPVANSTSSEEVQQETNEEPEVMDPNQSAMLVAFLFAVFLIIVWVGFMAAGTNSTRQLAYNAPSIPRAALTANPPSAVTPLARPQSGRTVTTSVVETGCSVLDRHGFVAFLFCPQGMSAIRLRLEGRKACSGKRICNVWMWDDRRHAARSLPMTDTQVNTAVAIWINATEELTICRSSGC